MQSYSLVGYAKNHKGALKMATIKSCKLLLSSAVFSLIASVGVNAMSAQEQIAQYTQQIPCDKPESWETEPVITEKELAGSVTIDRDFCQTVITTITTRTKNKQTTEYNKGKRWNYDAPAVKQPACAIDEGVWVADAKSADQMNQQQIGKFYESMESQPQQNLEDLAGGEEVIDQYIDEETNDMVTVVRRMVCKKWSDHKKDIVTPKETCAQKGKGKAKSSKKSSSKSKSSQAK